MIDFEELRALIGNTKMECRKNIEKSEEKKAKNVERFNKMYCESMDYLSDFQRTVYELGAEICVSLPIETGWGRTRRTIVFSTSKEMFIGCTNENIPRTIRNENWSFKKAYDDVRKTVDRGFCWATIEKRDLMVVLKWISKNKTEFETLFVNEINKELNEQIINSKRGSIACHKMVS